MDLSRGPFQLASLLHWPRLSMPSSHLTMTAPWLLLSTHSSTLTMLRSGTSDAPRTWPMHTLSERCGRKSAATAKWLTRGPPAVTPRRALPSPSKQLRPPSACLGRRDYFLWLGGGVRSYSSGGPSPPRQKQRFRLQAALQKSAASFRCSSGWAKGGAG